MPADLPPLRWGTEGSRVAWGAILIVSSAVGIAGSNANVLWILLIPSVLAHVAGWCILPSDGWRRVLAIVLSTPAAILLLSGPSFFVVLVVPYLAWLLVRRRSLIALPTVIFVLAGAIVLPRIFSGDGGKLPALSIELAIIVASAFAARALDRSRRLPRKSE